MPDIRIENAGSIVLIRPMTAAGIGWVEENVQAEPSPPNPALFKR